MFTETDYWLHNLTWNQAREYVQGNYKALAAEEIFFGRRTPSVFDRYSNHLSEEHANKHTVLRLSRAEPKHDYFILPPQLARDAAADDFDLEALTQLREPDVVHVSFEMLPNNGLVMFTIKDPFTNTPLSSAIVSDVYWLWRPKDLVIEPAEPITDRINREKWYEDRSQDNFYAQAIMMKHFTYGLDYDFKTMLLPLATSEIPLEEKLVLLHGEFKQYRADGLPETLLKELLPRG